MPRWTGRRVTPISRERSRSSQSASRSPIRFRRNDGSARRAPLRIQSARQRAMQEMLANPAVQGGLAPFIAALTVTALLAPFRLGGLAVVAAFATAVYFIAGFTFEPLTATRKIILLGFAAPLANPRRMILRVAEDHPSGIRRAAGGHRHRFRFPPHALRDDPRQR